MDINKKDRTELKHFFKENARPTEEQFADFIDATINQADDGIAKVPGDPIAIQAEGDTEGTQEVLNLYLDFKQDNPDWSLNLNPRVNPNDPNTNKKGLNIKDADGESRLFIKSGESKIGIGTIDPTAPLTIKGTEDITLPDTPMQIAADSLMFGGQNTEESNSARINVDNNTLNVYGKSSEKSGYERKVDIHAEGGMGIKGAVAIDGNISAKNIDTNAELGNELADDDKIPSQKAVKTYVDTRLPKGMITMWSGKVAPEGWAICNGENGTPNLSGRFIVGYDKDSPDYSETGNSGGLENVRLTIEEIPAHTHSGSTSNNGKHKHNVENTFSHNGSGKGTNSLQLDGENHGKYKYNTKEGGEHSHTFQTTSIGGGGSHENRPPYFVLAYIMKL